MSALVNIFVRFDCSKVLTMPSLKYFTKGESNPTTIYMRFVHGRKFDFKKSTSLLVNPKYWNNAQGKVKHLAEFTDKINLQNSLDSLRSEILGRFNTSYANGGIIDSDWLRNAIDSYFDQNTDTDLNYLTDYTNHFIDLLPYRIQKNGTTGVSTATGKQYRVTLNKILAFEKKKRKRLRVDEVNLKFHNDFIRFLNQEQKLNLNTIGKYLKCLKTVLKSAKQYGLKVHPDIDKDGFRSTKEKTYFVTLDETEIDTIFNLDLSHRPYLDNARNWLIFGVWTGARVSDLLNFTTDNINNGFLEYTAQKTKQKIMLPVHWQIQSIVDRNDGKLPHRISDQRYNDWIKDVCQLAGIDQMVKGAIFITDTKSKTKKVKTPQRKVVGHYPKWQMVSTHTARRSFATNHYGKLPTPVIMAATGHTTERMLLQYIQKAPKDNAQALLEYWQKETKKKAKKSSLQVVKTAN